MQPEVILSFFAKYIESELGIIYAEHNYFQLQNRLEEISKLLSVESLPKLYELAQNGVTGAFRQLLLDLATNNETSFFRDPKIFKAIEAKILPAFLNGHSQSSSFAIWSAASSSGQEALTTSMMIKEWSIKNSKPLKFSITGTDISERILLKAKAAQYSQLEVQRGLPTPLLLKYFTKDVNDRWTANKDLTETITYKKQNLKENFSFTDNFFLILCRNVLIYQSVEGKTDIIKRLTAKLAPGGFLILGSGESLLGLSSDYEQTDVDGAIVYQKRQPLQKTA